MEGHIFNSFHPFLTPYISSMKRAFAILSCLILLSCEKELDLDIDFEGEKLAISCLISPYDSVSVSIERTNDPNLGSEQYSLITIADIVLIEDGVELTDFEYDSTSGAFVSDYLPWVGPEYQLIVEVPGYEPIVSKMVTIPDKLPMSLEKTETIVTGPPNQPERWYDFNRSAKIQLKFHDSGNQENFYLTRIDRMRDSGPGGYTMSLGGALNEGCNFSEYGFGNYVFDDFCFNGLETTVEFEVSYGGTHNFVLELFFLDQNTHAYIKQLGLYKIALYQTELNLDPVRVPSSFENAYGVFGAYNYSVSNILFE